VRRHLWFRTGIGAAVFGRLHSGCQLPERGFELRDLLLLPVDLVTKLEDRLILVGETHLEIVDSCVYVIFGGRHKMDYSRPARDAMETTIAAHAARLESMAEFAHTRQAVVINL
jgi:hypothetical protein